MRSQWLGMSSWWTILIILILVGLVILIIRAFKPSNRIINIKRRLILSMLEFSKSTGKIDPEEFELRKTIILEEEDEHFEDSNIYLNLEKYARMEIDSRTYFELINRRGAAAGSEKAMDILRERYARGEIDEEEYRNRKNQLLH